MMVYTMRVDYLKSVQRGKIYTSILLRHATRVNGKTKHVTIANLSKLPQEDVDALDWSLKNKKKVRDLKNMNFKRRAGKKFGAVYLLNEIIKKLGIDKALGGKKESRLALFQILSCAIGHGSCLSATRMAKHRAVSEVLNIEETASEDELYKNLSWLAHKQKSIEKKLFKSRYKDKEPEMFLYDVTSSYFEGTHNELANWGYNRDKKRGKMQVVAGLLCDESGYPLSIKLFEGNTLDFNTVGEQIKQVAKEFGCERVSFVGDRGMLKSKQIKELESADFHYITAITKPQIAALLKEKIFQMSLFDSEIKEIEHEGVRYILKRNPLRADELRLNREGKKARIEKLLAVKNEYLRDHKRAKPETAIKNITKRINQLKVQSWLSIEVSEKNMRGLVLKEDLESLSQKTLLDGCYVIKSNLPEEVGKDIIHDRYKDLKYVEQGFRTMKTDWLELRPWYVRTEDSTRGRAFVVMLAYMLIKYLKDAWKEADVTVEEGIEILDGLSLLEVRINENIQYNELPEPDETMSKLANLAGIKYPEIVPYKKGKVYSRKKLIRKA